MRKPKHFDYNMLSIGAGSAGLVTSYIAAALKAKCALIEKHRMGGDCLNTGCIPSKALLHQAKKLKQFNNFQKKHMSGSVSINEVTLDDYFIQSMQHVHKSIKSIEPHDSMDRYQSLGVDCFAATAELVSPWHVCMNKGTAKEKTVTAKNITLATGASPRVPNIPGLDQIPYCTSNNLFQLKQRPKHILIVGGGPIGVEMAQAFVHFGSRVSLIEKHDRILHNEDSDISVYVQEQLKQDGVEFYFNTNIDSFKKQNNQYAAHIKQNAQAQSLNFDTVLFAIGRIPNSIGFGFDVLNLDLHTNKSIQVDSYQRTLKYKHIFAAGDVAGPYQLTHMAAHQAWYCVVNALFAPWKKFKVDYNATSWATYTSPELATVGLNEIMAQKQNLSYDVFTYDLKKLDRALTENKNKGLVKVLTKKNKDTVIGASIVSEHASTMIMEFAMAIKHKIGLNKILSTIHPYPSYNEANKFAAGQWKQSTAKPWLMKLLSKYHYWNR